MENQKWNREEEDEDEEEEQEQELEFGGRKNMVGVEMGRRKSKWLGEGIDNDYYYY